MLYHLLTNNYQEIRLTIHFTFKLPGFPIKIHVAFSKEHFYSFFGTVFHVRRDDGSLMSLFSKPRAI